MTMIVINLHEAKAKLSEYLDAVANGQRVVICKRNRPIAELRAIEARPTTPRPIGLGKGLAKIPPSFFEPLPDDLLDAFQGANGNESRAGERPPRAAERPTEFGARRRKKPAR